MAATAAQNMRREIDEFFKRMNQVEFEELYNHYQEELQRGSKKLEASFRKSRRKNQGPSRC